MTALAVVLALTVSQVRPGVLVKDEGVSIGYVWTVDCLGAGVTCTYVNGTWRLTVAGGGGSGLPADPAACPGGQFVTDQDASGVLTCATPSGSGGAPTTATYITQTPDAGLSAEQPLSALASGILTVTTGTGVVASSAPTDDTLLIGNGSIWESKAIPSCAGASDVLTYQPAGNTIGCSSTKAQSNDNYVTFSASAALTNDRVLTAGTSTTIDTATAGQVKVNVVSPVATSSALAADGANCSAGQAPLGVDAAGAVQGCFTPAGTYTLPILTSTVLGGVKGTGSALVCGGTDKATGFDAAGALQCGTDQTSAGGGYATIQDEAASLTQRATVNFTGAGVSCVDNAGATRTDCTIAGGGGGGISPLTVAAFGGF